VKLIPDEEWDNNSEGNRRERNDHKGDHDRTSSSPKI